MRTLGRIVHRVVTQTDGYQILARLLHRFGNGDWHFACLAVAEADSSSAIADDRERCEAELAAALDYFRDAVDGHEFFEKLIAGCRFINSGHLYYPSLKLW